ncbi:MAG: proline dehydrogenase [Crocinitomicaceae bacterium]|nr:proline dehydrogenase [Crocinitomicaceae bacterium]|tara:strand:+ start:424 stop:1599 length:1176 start_codon:yes stop_codon:yes gene_type:complete
MISFENTKIAFHSKSSKDLKRAYWLFKIIANPKIVLFGKWLTNMAIKINLPIRKIIKRTIFKQFCGGESIFESLKLSKQLSKYNLKTILDYSIEGKLKEEDFNHTVNEIIATINEGKSNKDIPFAVFKISGICSFSTLKKMNNGTHNIDSEINKEYKKLNARIDLICKAAYNANVPVFIDAEESWIQNSIDNLVKEMSIKYNKNRAIIFNTVQLYRHDKLSFVKNEIEHARKNKYFLGLKLVRGAYMEKERQRAEKKGYPSPIQPNKKVCDEHFDKAMEIILKNIDVTAVCVGTHNEKSSIKLTELMSAYKIKKNDPRIYFAQLLGMSDHISYNLSHNGYNVAKYIPYGPVKEVLPYLLRRADENTSVAGQTTRELSLIRKEIKRRKKQSK